MNFSFCMPTRGIKEPIIKMLDSFERTTKYKKKIEFLFAIDEGKTDICDVVEQRGYTFSTRFFERPITEDFTNDYYNWLADRTVGNIIVGFNDDTWMKTPNWDAKILTTVRQYGCKVFMLDQYGCKIFMLDVLDTARMKYRHPFPCFPFISRKSVCGLGWLLHPKIPVYPADKITYDVYSRCERVIPIRNIIIEHEHVKETDESKRRMFDLFMNNKTLKRDVNGIPQVDIGNEIMELSKLAQRDKPLRLNKFNRIMNILKEK